MDDNQAALVSIVRYGELRPCRTAFIDAHTPGSDRKENFTIIGGGVSESAEQFVHIRETPGFNIGAAGQPPHCRNSLHSHRTAEVFFVHSGIWRFFWGRYGTAGEVVLDEGDLIDIPTGIFRGFENVGTDYGLIMSVLGGNDAGGGVIWAPQVIEEARAHGLLLSERGRLYNTKRNETLPPDEKPMPLLSSAELERFPEVSVEAMVPRFIARHRDMQARGARSPVKVVGARGALILDRPGFEVEFASRGAFSDQPVVCQAPEVLMIHRGHWRLTSGVMDTVLAPGDVALLRDGTHYSVGATMTGECGLFRVHPTGDPAGPTWKFPE